MIQVTGLFNPPNRQTFYDSPTLVVTFHGDAGKLVCDVAVMVNGMMETSFPIFDIKRENLTYDSNIADTYDRLLNAILNYITGQLASPNYSLTTQ